MSPLLLRRCAVLAFALMMTNACAVINFPPLRHSADSGASSDMDATAFTPRPKPYYATDGQRAGEPFFTSSSLRGTQTVVVAREDNLFAIAAEHGVGIGALIQANDLAPPYELLEGQVLTIPAANAYRVRAGDTLYAIAARYRVSHAALADLNGIASPYVIRPGQVIQVPGQPDAFDRQAGAPSSGDQTTPVAVRAPDQPVPTPTFQWPLVGHLISRYGPDGVARNDGVNIATVEGEPVRAAAAGKVVYAASFQGYGNFILVRHNQEWVTAYGHNRRLRVTLNQEVAQGDIIAEAGSTGAVETPQLHFEVRRLGRPADPLDHLPMM